MKPHEIERDIQTVYGLMNSCHDRLCEALHHRESDGPEFVVPGE